MVGRFIITIDYNRCIGCYICEMVCSLIHVGECNRERSRIRILKIEKDGVIECLPVLCLNCEEPLCEKICPTRAIKRGNFLKAMLVNEQLCIGCNGCVYACPFGACFLDHVKDKVILCDHCQGEPKCVQFCPTECLAYIREDKLSIQQKRIKSSLMFV